MDCGGCGIVETIWWSIYGSFCRVNVPRRCMDDAQRNQKWLLASITTIFIHHLLQLLILSMQLSTFYSSPFFLSLFPYLCPIFLDIYLIVYWILFFLLLSFPYLTTVLLQYGV